MYTVFFEYRRSRVHLPVVEEAVILERIEFIARLGVCYESQARDKEIALIWISELAGNAKGTLAEQVKTKFVSDSVLLR